MKNNIVKEYSLVALMFCLSLGAYAQSADILDKKLSEPTAQTEPDPIIITDTRLFTVIEQPVLNDQQLEIIHLLVKKNNLSYVQINPFVLKHSQIVTLNIPDGPSITVYDMEKKQMKDSRSIYTATL